VASKKTSEKIHIVGIKGVGVVGLATIFKEMGKDVTGSDTSEVFFTDRILNELKIPLKLIGFGEGVEDLRDFEPQDFVNAFLSN